MSSSAISITGKMAFTIRPVHLHLDFKKGGDFYRPFLIASSTTEDYLLFTTRMRAGSIYKQKLNGLKPGDELTVVGPVGSFTLPEDSSKHVVFLGGGIGITPFRSMAKFATDMRLPHKIILLYSNRTPEEVVYRQGWKELEGQNPNLTMVHTITRPEESQEKWKGRVGRIEEALIREYVKDFSNACSTYVGHQAWSETWCLC